MEDELITVTDEEFAGLLAQLRTKLDALETAGELFAKDGDGQAEANDDLPVYADGDTIAFLGHE